MTFNRDYGIIELKKGEMKMLTYKKVLTTNEAKNIMNALAFSYVQDHYIDGMDIEKFTEIVEAFAKQRFLEYCEAEDIELIEKEVI